MAGKKVNSILVNNAAKPIGYTNGTLMFDLQGNPGINYSKSFTAIPYNQYIAILKQKETNKKRKRNK